MDAQVVIFKIIIWSKKFGKGGRNGIRLTLKVSCQFQNLKHVLKLNLHPWSHYVKKNLGIQVNHHHLFWKEKNIIL
jgi:hypothetical protein